MPSTIQLETSIVNAEKYFSTLMDGLVDSEMELYTVKDSISCRINELFYTIEAIRFLFDMEIYTDNATCMTLYKKMMYQIGVYSGSPTLDNTLIQPINII